MSIYRLSIFAFLILIVGFSSCESTNPYDTGPAYDLEGNLATDSLLHDVPTRLAEIARNNTNPFIIQQLSHSNNFPHMLLRIPAHSIESLRNTTKRTFSTNKAKNHSNPFRNRNLRRFPATLQIYTSLATS